jgi:hypothetical protein
MTFRLWNGAVRIGVQNGHFSFLSAWNPPNKFYSHLRSLGFVVDALYCEPGNNFCGIDDSDGDKTFNMDDAPEIIRRYFSEHFE